MDQDKILIHSKKTNFKIKKRKYEICILWMRLGLIEYGVGPKG